MDDLAGLGGQGRYLRVLATQRGTSYGYSLYEVEAFGPATPLAVAAASVGAAGLGVHPNPAAGPVSVTWVAAAAATTHLTLTNATGQVMLSQAVASPAGPATLALDLAPYAPGSYLLTLQSPGEAPRRVRVLKAE